MPLLVPRALSSLPGPDSAASCYVVQADDAAGARRLLLTHVPAWNEPDDAVAEARAMFSGPVLSAYPGMVVAL